MAKCPFFGVCGGCAYDFDTPAYRENKMRDLPTIQNMMTPIWGGAGQRRRADFVAAPGKFGFYKAASRDIVNITNCPNVLPEINAILPNLAGLPWTGVASVLVTKCENGIVVNVTVDIPYFDAEFRAAVQKLPQEIIRFTWNGGVVRDYEKPIVAFDDVHVPFPDGAFLQPTLDTEKKLRDMVVAAVAGSRRVADLFCGIGNFTFATHATGFDINGVGTSRDLFKKPLVVVVLNRFDTVIMDPPRAGAFAQTKLIAKSKVQRVIYISCNPDTWARDRDVLLRGGFKLKTVTPVDQFVGTTHWEVFSVFER